MLKQEVDFDRVEVETAAFAGTLALSDQSAMRPELPEQVGRDVQHTRLPRQRVVDFHILDGDVKTGWVICQN